MSHGEEGFAIVMQQNEKKDIFVWIHYKLLPFLLPDHSPNFSFKKFSCSNSNDTLFLWECEFRQDSSRL